MNGPYRTGSPECDRDDPRVWCPRCEAKRRVIRPWGGWRKARVVWCGTAGLLLVLAPILAFDYVFMTPTALVIAAAIGPLNHFASIAPTCRTCGWAFDHDEADGPGSRWVARLRGAAMQRSAGRSTEV